MNRFDARFLNTGTDPDQIPQNKDLGKCAYQDVIPVSQVGTGKITDDAQVKRTEMGVANGVATLDSTGKVPAAQLSSVGGGSSKWSSLTASTDFSTTAASTSTITMVTDQTANISPGMAIKFTLSGTVYYAICSAITSSLLTISGAPLTTTASALTALSYSIFPGMVEELVFSIGGPWADNVDTSLLENDLNTYFYWTKAPAYLVKIDAITKTTDSSGTAFPRVNARIGTTTSNYISTSNSNAGLSLAASATKYSTTVDISSAMYAISNGSRIEIKTDANGTNLDASDLTIILTVVFA